MSTQPHPETVYLSNADKESLIAYLEAALYRAERLAERYETLAVEPGGPEHWHVPQVRALTPWTDEPQEGKL